MKYSRQRELILNNVIDSKGHPTADDVYDDLKKANPSLSLGTVYRNLTQLEKNGMLKKVNIPVVDFSEKLLDEQGLKIKSSYVILTGTCSECHR